EKEQVAAILKPPAPEEAAETGPAGPAFQVGDWVRMEGLRDPVRVLALKRDGREAQLEVGGMHLWIDAGKLTSSTPPRGEAAPAVRVSLTDAAPLTYELDLRGMTGDEAAFAVEKYLADASVSGWKSVRIIHGKGTGALRTRVQEVLRRWPGIKSFRFGRPEEGEFGVTVVELE
ncbi:MAG: hypothetical protein C4524_08985, partial [Candidatus Zixiibacteriota bacterium]